MKITNHQSQSSISEYREGDADRIRTKKADLASGMGAGVLGGGLGLLAARYFDNTGFYAVWLIAIGTLLHSWGMFERHRLDATAPRAWWAEALYWLCWGILIVIGIVLILW